MSRKTPGEVRARTCGTKSPSRSEALRFIDSSKSLSTKIASDLAKFYQDWGPDLCESHWRAHSLIGVSFECPYQHPPWSPVSNGKPAPKIHQWTIYYFVDGELDESIKRSASDRLGDLVTQVRARTSRGVFRDMALLGLCLELSFSVLYCRTQANLPTLKKRFYWTRRFALTGFLSLRIEHCNQDRINWNSDQNYTMKLPHCYPELLLHSINLINKILR